MDILREKFNEIEYYLIDVYENEFPFGTIYHFISKDNDKKFCFYKHNTYIPIKNKIYLRKINKELKINCDILFKGNILKNISNNKNKNTYVEAQRWDLDKEHKAYDEVSNMIHELFPDIPYEDTMEVLDDNAGIYSHYLENDIEGQYHPDNKKIYLDRFIKNEEKIKRTVLHECIHKLTDRNYFLHNNEFIGIIEGATEKICEDMYGDKTSHIEFLEGKDIHINFSYDASYSLQQVIYRQISQVLGTKKCDKGIINGQENVFDEFSNLYGKDLFLYLSHRCNRLLKKKLPEKKKLKYFKEAQTMLLTRVFDKKISFIETEEDIINYMTELRNFEYVSARIGDDTTFQDYYENKYNFVMQLAKRKGIELSKINQFQYSKVDFYPERNCEKPSPFEITREHVYNLSLKQEVDFNNCKRIQVEPSSNFFNLDIILQNNIPISIIYDTLPFDVNHIEADDEYFDFIVERLGIEDSEIDIYNIAQDTYMIIKDDGSSTIYFEDSETEKISTLSKNEVDLEITLEDIEHERVRTENSIAITISEFEDKNRINTILNNIKNLFQRIFENKKSLLLEASKDQNIDMANKVDSDTIKNINHLHFVQQLNPNNPIYDDNKTLAKVMPLEENDKKEIDKEEEI